MPPPADAQRSMDSWIAVVFSVLPSPTAPVSAMESPAAFRAEREGEEHRQKQGQVRTGDFRKHARTPLWPGRRVGKGAAVRRLVRPPRRFRGGANHGWPFPSLLRGVIRAQAENVVAEKLVALQPGGDEGTDALEIIRHRGLEPRVVIKRAAVLRVENGHLAAARQADAVLIRVHHHELAEDSLVTRADGRDVGAGQVAVVHPLGQRIDEHARRARFEDNCSRARPDPAPATRRPFSDPGISGGRRRSFAATR